MATPAENLYTPDCLRTTSGQYVNLKAPDPDTIYIGDIAHHLCHEPRFAGAVKRYYSVASHCLRCLDLAREFYPNAKDLHLKVLLHDAHEYLLKDIPSPLKRLLVGYAEIAALLQDAIHKRFGIRIAPTDSVRIAEIDRLVLEEEFAGKVVRWKGMVLDFHSTYELFLHEFKVLCTFPHVIWPPVKK